MDYITVQEASEKWNIGTRRVCILCKSGRIPGVVKKSRVWMIPSNAKKPEDARKPEGKGKNANTRIDNAGKGVNPFLLLYNPDFLDKHQDIQYCENDRQFCEIQKKFFCGNIEEAYRDIHSAFLLNTDIRYNLIFRFLKIMISVDMGKKEECLNTIQEIYQMKIVQREFPIEMQMFDLLVGTTTSFDNEILFHEEYSEYMPLLSMICARRGLNEIIQNEKCVNILNYEIICRELENKDCSLISSYYHLFLSVYYNAIGDKMKYQYHINKAVKVLLKYGWYTPLAEYSATIDISFIEDVDPKAYRTIKKLSDEILISYVKIGIFDELSDNPRMKMDMNIQIGYKIAQGKSNEVIASELGISQYKVKQHIEDLYSIVGANSRKEIKNFILKNLKM